MYAVSTKTRSLIAALALSVATFAALPDCCLAMCPETSAHVHVAPPMAHHHPHAMSEPAGAKTPILTMQDTTCRHCRIAEPAISLAKVQPFTSIRPAALPVAAESQSATLSHIPDISPPRSPALLSVSTTLRLPLRI